MEDRKTYKKRIESKSTTLRSLIKNMHNATINNVLTNEEIQYIYNIIEDAEKRYINEIRIKKPIEIL